MITKAFAFASICVLAVCLCSSALAAGPRVEIVIGADAPPLERFAAEEFKSQLERLFQADANIASTVSPVVPHVILLGSPNTNAAIRSHVNAWPALSEQGHVLQSVTIGKRQALALGGGTPLATLWVVYELGQHWGIRYFLFGDLFPVIPPPFTLAGHEAVFEPRPGYDARAWDLHAGSPLGTASWGLEEQRQLMRQLTKLKFNRLTMAASHPPLPAIRVEGDTAGRAAFRGAKLFESAVPSPQEASKAARELSLKILQHSGRPVKLSILPMASSTISGELSVPIAQVGDLDLAANHLSRAAFGGKLTLEQTCHDLVTPVCGEEVSTRVWKAFQYVEQATSLVQQHDSDLGTPSSTMLLTHLRNEPVPAWWLEARDAYLNAMNEMYRANTRAREGSRSFTLYHARRSEFAFSYMNCLHAVRKAGIARAKPDPEAALTELETAVEAIYGALNALAAVARSPSDRATIALLNEYAYRPLKRELEAAEGASRSPVATP